MITTQTRSWTEAGGWTEPTVKLPDEAQLVFVFGDRALVAKGHLFESIKQFYPEAYILTGSTSGNILNDTVTENSVTVSALHFEKTKIWYTEAALLNEFDSQNVGKKLAEFLPTENLVHSFVLSEGLAVNGSELVRSVNEHLPKSVTVTGGLAGDGTAFAETLVGCNAAPQRHQVALIGFYSTALKVGYAAEGGWSPTEFTYTITKSKGNVLYELNGRPALTVYKELMGEQAAGLPGSGLLFPLELELADGQEHVVRTILAVDEAAGSVTFAGDMPEGVTVHVMNTTNEALINSAYEAGQKSAAAIQPDPAQFALLVSCVGRRLVLKERTVEEVQAVRKALGDQATLHGFYSYGELCPKDSTDTTCLMHNQTMTITTFVET